MRIAFVTDSTAYLTPQQVEAYGIHVVPLTVILDGRAYREGVDIDNATFYRLMAESKSFPTTSQASVGEFVALFERLLSHHDAVMCLLLSSQFSGTFQTAQTAAQMVGGNIYVVDSRISSYGIAGPLIDGVVMARHGASPEDILAVWEQELAEMNAYFVIDTLEYLHRGGRIGGAAAVLGSLLQIKPILTVRDGRIELYEKVRTRKRAMEFMLAKFAEAAASGRALQVGVVHSQREEEAAKLRSELEAAYPHIRTDISELGPVIGAHTGPGVLALVYYPRAEAVP
ncbi:hypothetical protein GCM10010885_23910 [Alicyclobacillus cellulosilyticus]|uniref:DegV family protein with EDD domain n=1 Tax=Alicyclobacillus cellulosilyticus TaxID=1003997 RepID=A0A917NNM7_9BACL|nr:DegV family protein [Alicyclobacillus cellulosilyticus]GGJ13773.1 hypothetical protein GCM10010885_23910 [Alicyclobacillus cellulosilyticus]